MVSISKSYQLQPAETASASWTNWPAIVPRYRPPASRLRHVAIRVALGGFKDSCRRKFRISRSLESQSSRSFTVRVSTSARVSWRRMARASGDATSAQRLFLPNILYFLSLLEASRNTPDLLETREFLLLSCGAQCVKPSRPLS